MLKEKVIKFLEDNPDFLSMGTWLITDKISSCGTVGCLAGAILVAGEIPFVKDSFEILQPELSFNIDKWKYEETRKANPIIAAAARKLWADEYGDESAKKLPFNRINWNKPLWAVTNQDVIDKLNELVP